MGKLKNTLEAMEYMVEGNKSKNYEKFLSDLAYKESSNRHYCVNQFRFSGLYQIRAEGAGRTPYYHCEKDVTEWIPKNWKNYNKITKYEEFLGVKDGFNIAKAAEEAKHRKDDYQKSMVSESRKEQAVIAQTDMIIKFHKAIWNEIVYNVTTYDEYKNMKELKTQQKYGKISEEIKRILGIGKDSVRNGKPCLCTIIDDENSKNNKTYRFKITQSGIIAATHLVGAGPVKTYLLTGVIDDKGTDGNGTSLTEYMWRFADYDMTDLFNGKDIKYVPGSGANPEKIVAGSKSSGTGGTNGSSKKEGAGKGQGVKPDNVKHNTVKADNNTLYPDSASGKIVIRGFNPGDLKINIPRYDADGKGVTKKQENQNNTITESKIEYGTVTGKVVCDGAKIYCDAGGYSTLKSSKQSFFKINGKNVILESENTKSNIVPFKTCAASSGKICTPVAKKPWSNTVDHLLVSNEKVVTTFSTVLCSTGMLDITIRDGNQQGVEYGATAKVTRTEGAATGETKEDDTKDNKEIKEAKPVTLDEKKSATAKIKNEKIIKNDKINSKLSREYPMEDNVDKWIVFCSGVNSNIDPIFLRRLAALARDYNCIITLNDGYRTFQQQESLFFAHGGSKSEKTGKYVKPLHWKGSEVAVPGNGYHEFGLAIDTSSKWLKAINKTEKSENQKILKKYGLHKPLTKGNFPAKKKWEDWHIEPYETVDMRKRKANPAEKEGYRKAFQEVK